MTHPIIDLQASIIEKLDADAALGALIGENGIFDMPPRGRTGPYIVVLRHDLVVRDADEAPANEHRIQFRVWNPSPSRSGVLEPAERVVLVMLQQDLGTPTLIVSNVIHQGTDTAIDVRSGRAHATIRFRIFSEPVI